jgi:hypothetical protein
VKQRRSFGDAKFLNREMAISIEQVFIINNM